MKRLLGILTVFFFPLAAAAETTTINLSNALELGMKNNLTLLQTIKDVEIAKSQVNQAFASLYLPDITASGSFSLLDPQTVDNATTVYMGVTNQSVWQDNCGMALKITKPLFAGFSLRTTYDLRQWNYELAQKKLEDKRREVRYQITKDFYNLFLVQENIVLMEDLQTQLSQTVMFTRANYRAGLASDYDLIQVEVQWLNQKPNILKMKNAYETAKLAFCQSIGLDSSEGVVFIGSLWDATNLTVPGVPDEEIVSMAMTNDINLVSLQYALRTYDFSLRLAQAARYPSLSAYFNVGLDYKKNYDRETTDDPERAWNSSWTAGLQLSIPIDDWIPVSSQANAIREVEANREKTKLAIEQYVQTVRLQTLSLLKTIQQSLETMAGQRASVAQSQRGLDIANRQYQAGLISSLELNKAEVSYQDSRTQYLQVVYDYIGSVLKLKRMIGASDFSADN